MNRVPSLSFRELEKLLLKNGFILDHVRGSHYVYYQEEKNLRVTVPHHTKAIPRGTLVNILKQAQVEWDK